MMKYPNKERLEQLRSAYPDGTRIVLLQMDDAQAPPNVCSAPGGKTFTLAERMEDTGSLLVHWDNGSTLNVLYGIDRCLKIRKK
jgi:hypothetical protein